jgi:acetylglutamate kinase
MGVVVVHGGGPQADALAEKLGHRVRKVAGRRITDDDALEIAKMVYGGSINVEILAALKRHGTKGVGVSGVDGSLISVSRRPPTRISELGDTDTAAPDSEALVDFGHVGDIVAVDTALLELLLSQGYVPVVASLAADEDGHIYNVNADTIAQALSVALKVDRLVMVTNVPGILLDVTDPGSLVQTCAADDLKVLIESGAVSAGMVPKVQNCIRALRAGVRAVQILGGTVSEPRLLESLYQGGIGTLITGGGGSCAQSKQATGNEQANPVERPLGHLDRKSI